jgi:hypothetical protein
MTLRGILSKSFLGFWMVLAPYCLSAQTSSVTLSATTVDFGLQLEHPNFSPTKQITLTSSGPSPLLLGSLSIQGIPNEFRESDDCPQNGVLDVGNFCTIFLTVFPVDDGPRSATLSIVDSAPDSPQKIALSAIGHPLSVTTLAVSFPVFAVNTTDGEVSVGLGNVGNRPVTVKAAITGDFSFSDGCAPALGDVIPPGGFCFLNVSFTPAAPGPRAGTLTISGDNVTGPQVIQLSGTGSAAAVSTSSLEYPIQMVGVTSSQIVTLSNVYTKPLAVGRINASGDFSEKDDCDRWLAPNSSCSITVAFSPTDVGPREGMLVLNDKDPSSPQSVALSGYGVAPMKHIYVHYDYMVMPDQGTACTPRNLFPGDNFSADCAQFQTCIDNVCRGHSHAPDPRAIDTIIEAFRKHGSELHIDPHHAAIPEQSTFIQFGPPLGCPNSVGAVNFYDLRAQYYQPGHKFEHYVIFGHNAQDTRDEDLPCAPRGGAAELPPQLGTGQNVLVAVGYLLDRGLSPDSLVRWEAGTFMHELGHNLGLNHGGGLFDQGDPISYKPNFISVMNYNHQSGIIQADAVGSEQKKSCSRDKDCGPAALCAPAYSNVTCPPSLCAPPDKTKFCTRYDYSDQLLPTGGPTPGVLSENGQLSEPAGLGSGRPDVFRYTDGTCAPRYWPSDGPVDWDGDGDTTGTGLTVDLIFTWWATVFGGDCPTTNYIPVVGHNDWEDLAALQERAHTGHSWKSNPGPHRGHELTFEEAVANHILLPPRLVTVLAPSACWSLSSLIAGKSSTITLQLLGADDLDVSQIDTSSLKLHGVAPATVNVMDVNGDGRPDLLLTFSTASLKLHPNAKRMTLTGFLKNSQAFWGHADIGCQ